MTSYLGNPRNERELHAFATLLLTYIHSAGARSALRSVQRYAPYSGRLCFSDSWPGDKSIVGFSRYSTAPRHTGLFKMIVGVLTTCHTQYT